MKENIGHGLRVSVQLEICEGRTMQLFRGVLFLRIREGSYPSTLRE